MNPPRLDEITFRDLLALFAIAGLASVPKTNARIAELAYEIADRALEVREKTHD